MQSLPPEIQILIFQDGQMKSLLQLSLCSKALHALCIPLIYRTVSLSDHNEPGSFPSQYAVKVSADSPDRILSASSLYTLHDRQQSFIRSLTTRPSYGTLVYSLSWTYRSLYQCSGKFKPSTPIWAAFARLLNVRHLDFCSLPSTESVRIHKKIAHTLFPSVKSIRLGGHMGFDLASAVLHRPNPGTLTSLHLGNLQGIKAPLRGHLRYLAENKCCSCLARLTTETVGQDYIGDLTWNAEDGLDRYAEWAAFLRSVRVTLQVFTFVQGLRDHDPDGLESYRRGGMPAQRERPMDARFEEIILQALIDGGPWPVLARVEIRGVGGDVRTYYRSCHRCSVPEGAGKAEAVRETLRKGLGSGVEVAVEREVGKTFWRRS